MNRWTTLGLLLLAAVALLLRWPQPDARPLHNDEAVNGLKFGALWERGAYKYDPNEHHGPTLYYFSTVVGKLTGAPSKISGISDARLRWVTILFGLGFVLTVLLLRDGLGTGSMIWAGIFAAVSPAFVFYSEYYIHEMLLLFFTAGVLGCAWRYWRSRKIGWAIGAGISAGLMAATKETFVLTFAAAAVALILGQAWNRLIDATGRPTRAVRIDFRHLVIAATAGIFTAILFFSSFFTNAAGPVDAIRTYEPWLSRAGGASPHIHPWSFYFERLLFFTSDKGPLWTEGFILLLAICATFAAFSRKRLGDTSGSFARFLAFYSLVLAGFYAVIPYKTPWCLLGFWHGFILLAGVGAAWLIRSADGWRKIVLGLLLLGGTVHLAIQSYLATHRYDADRRNPYVYAQTSHNFRCLTTRVAELVKSTAGTDTLVKVVGREGDYWPLPWYFREFKNVGWWESLPQDPYAPIMVVSADFDARLDDKQTHLMVGYFELRPSVFLELYVEFSLWEKFLAARK